MSRSTAETVHQMLTGEDDGRVCRDIPDAACREQPGNFLRHVISLSATKAADGLVSPKLVLAWLLGALGAPAGLVGLLVPIREAGALLPQLVIAAGIRALPRRKWVWAAGSVVQGLSALGIAIAAATLDGAAAGWTVVGLLALLALARSACSVSYKDVLGKTVSRATRGTATGTASSISAVIVLVFAAGLVTGLLPTTIPVVIGALAVAGGLWLAAAILFVGLAEAPGATDGGGNPIAMAVQQFRLLGEDRQLRRFILARSLLTVTALAPPFLVALAPGGEDGVAELGLFVLAGALASLLSGYAWGRLSDRSSRRVLIVAGMLAAAALAIGALLDGSLDPGLQRWLIALLILCTLVAHQGVRLGRSTHLVDMAGADRRAAYTALSNSLVGLVLVAGGGFAILMQLAGAPAVLGVMAVLAVLGAVVAIGLDEVQARD